MSHNQIDWTLCWQKNMHLISTAAHPPFDETTHSANRHSVNPWWFWSTENSLNFDRNKYMGLYVETHGPARSLWYLTWANPSPSPPFTLANIRNTLNSLNFLLNCGVKTQDFQEYPHPRFEPVYIFVTSHIPFYRIGRFFWTELELLTTRQDAVCYCLTYLTGPIKN